MRNGAFSGLVLSWLLLSGCGGEPSSLGSAAEHYLAAQDALGKGDKELALQELDKSLSLQGEPWAYLERGRLLAEMNQDEKALADCAAGLKLDEDHAQLKWLQEELRKPKDRRFKGKNAEPPSTK